MTVYRHRSCRLCANNGHRATSHQGNLNPRASTSTTAVQPYENFVSFGPCVRVTDQKQASEQGPAFAKYKCKTTRCEVDFATFLVVSERSRQSIPFKKQKSKQEDDPDTKKSNRSYGVVSSIPARFALRRIMRGDSLWRHPSRGDPSRGDSLRGDNCEETQERRR